MVPDMLKFALKTINGGAKAVEDVVPDLELVFSHACNTNDHKLKSIAPKGTVLEKEASRMRWITLAAEKFHGLMINQTAYMEGELNTMAAWCASPKNKSEMILESLQCKKIELL